MDDDEGSFVPIAKWEERDVMLRHAALDYALRTTQHDIENATGIVAVAEKYLAFLKGGDSK